MKIGAHETHPAADAFPLMLPHAHALLVDDIKTNGLRHPIVLHEGRILDGRNRYLACLDAKVEPAFVEYQGANDAHSLVLYVASENQSRRHQTADSLALSARRLARLARTRREQAKRQTKLPGVPELTTTEADRLLTLGAPELVAAVDHGDVPLTIAVKALALSPDDQRALAAAAVEPEPEPQRAQRTETRLTSRAIDLSPVDLATLAALIRYAERSINAEVRAGVALVRRMVPA